MQTLFGIAIQELDDEALGWFSRRLPVGQLWDAVSGHPRIANPGSCPERWCRYHGLLTDDIALKFTVTRSAAAIVIPDQSGFGRNGGVLLRHALSVYSRLCLLGGEFADTFAGNLLPLSMPWSISRSIGCSFPVHCISVSESAKISFDPQYAALSIRRDDRALNKMLQHAVPSRYFPIGGTGYWCSGFANFENAAR